MQPCSTRLWENHPRDSPLWAQLTDRARGRIFRTASGQAFLQHSVADINEEVLLFCFPLAAVHGFPILFRFCNLKKKKKILLAKGSDYFSVSHTINGD